MFNLHCVVIKAGGLHKARPFDFILIKTSIIIKKLIILNSSFQTRGFIKKSLRYIGFNKLKPLKKHIPPPPKKVETKKKY
jgi:hypothetical protein